MVTIREDCCVGKRETIDALFHIFVFLPNELSEETRYTFIMPREIDLQANCSQIEIKDRLTLLRENEMSTHYKCSDYVTSASRRVGRVATHVTVWRKWYIKWMYNVADHFRFGREIVAYAAAYIDRFASKNHAVLYSKDDFTVLVMTSLYIAVKVYSNLDNASALCASNLCLLTEGKFVEDDILLMEERMLKTFQWKLYPATAVCFLREYMQLIAYEIPEEKHRVILEVSKFVVEISIISYDYVTYPPSVKAYAALLIALNYVPETRSVAVKLPQAEPFCHLNGLVSAWYPDIFDELRESLADRPPYLLAKIAGVSKAQHSRSTSDTGVDSQELLDSPREVIPWWDIVVFDL